MARIHFFRQLDDSLVVAALDRFFIAAQELHDRQVAVQHAFQYGAARQKLRFLRQEMNAGLLIFPDFPAVGFSQTGDNFQQRRLAGAI